MPLKGVLKLNTVLEYMAPQDPIVRHILEDVGEVGAGDPEPEHGDCADPVGGVRRPQLLIRSKRLWLTLGPIFQLPTRVKTNQTVFS
jgi:hypothetical protein